VRQCMEKKPIIRSEQRQGYFRLMSHRTDIGIARIRFSDWLVTFLSRVFHACNRSWSKYLLYNVPIGAHQLRRTSDMTSSNKIHRNAPVRILHPFVTRTSLVPIHFCSLIGGAAVFSEQHHLFGENRTACDSSGRPRRNKKI
jgi:hypothetical protein